VIVCEGYERKPPPRSLMRQERLRLLRDQLGMRVNIPLLADACNRLADLRRIYRSALAQLGDHLVEEGCNLPPARSRPARVRARRRRSRRRVGALAS